VSAVASTLDLEEASLKTIQRLVVKSNSNRIEPYSDYLNSRATPYTNRLVAETLGVAIQDLSPQKRFTKKCLEEETFIMNNSIASTPADDEESPVVYKPARPELRGDIEGLGKFLFQLHSVHYVPILFFQEETTLQFYEQVVSIVIRLQLITFPP
jgi:hypothetical protein